MHYGNDPAASGIRGNETVAAGRDHAETSRSRPALLLAMLSLLFFLRVVAQAIQAVGEVGWLPGFDSWQSGAVGYPFLLTSQVLILVVQAVLVFLVATNRFRVPPLVSKILFVVGAVYFGFMLFRLLSGFTILDGHSWFDAPLPSIFHMVLAAFLLTLSTVRTARSGNRS